MDISQLTTHILNTAKIGLNGLGVGWQHPRRSLISPREYNGGLWSQARFNSFVKSALRAASRRWPAKYETLNDACVGTKTNIKTGRLAKHYRCNECQGEFPAKDVQVDHINPIVDPSTGFTTWDDVIGNMFCEKHNLQVLCTDPCHKAKTAREKGLAKERRNDPKV